MTCTQAREAPNQGASEGCRRAVEHHATCHAHGFSVPAGTPYSRPFESGGAELTDEHPSFHDIDTTFRRDGRVERARDLVAHFWSVLLARE